MTLKQVAWLIILSGFGTPCLAQTELRAYYNDDFFLETADGAFQLRIRGNFHLDSRLFQGEARGAPHSIDLRRARIDLQGRIHDRFTFRLQPELAGKPYLRNAWVDAEVSPAFHIRAGQMKVPFSSSWLTLDNNLNFIERGASTPIYPFFDRGVVLWGEVWGGTAVYNLGLHTGVGVDGDVGSGDIDDHKDASVRLFLQPFRNSEPEHFQGLFLVLQGTWGRMSAPTSRYETSGYRSADYESAIWRWRTEQVIGTDGRVTDRVSAEIDARHRLGSELHYTRGPLALSTEFLETHYSGIVLSHELFVGSTRTVQQGVHDYGNGSVKSWSTWASWYLTGESKSLTNQGWRAAKPTEPVGSGGPGSWEVLARYSRTWTAQSFFVPKLVRGFDSSSPSLPIGYTGSTPGALNSVTAAVLDGAHDMHELTAGLSWALNPMVKIQLNDVFLWAPESDRDGDGSNDNFLVSGALSGQADPGLKNRKTRWENAVMLRLIFKL